jgi:hypothetical protein
VVRNQEKDTTAWIGRVITANREDQRRSTVLSDVESKHTIESVYGTWYMDYSERNSGSWFLHRGSGWGRIVVFNENGEFEDSTYAPCGTGAHFWSGTWKWNGDDQTLFIQITKWGGIFPGFEPSESYMKGVALYLKEETEGEILLIPLNRGVELERNIE